MPPFGKSNVKNKQDGVISRNQLKYFDLVWSGPNSPLEGG